MLTNQTRKITFETRFQIGDIILYQGIKATVQGFQINTEIGANYERSNVCLICRILPNQTIHELVLRRIENDTIYALERNDTDIELIERPAPVQIADTDNLVKHPNIIPEVCKDCYENGESESADVYADGKFYCESCFENNQDETDFKVIGKVLHETGVPVVYLPK